MALSDAEKQKIRELKAQGYNFEQIAGFISGNRLNRGSTVQSDEFSAFQAEEREAVGRFADVGEDVVTGARQLGQDLTRRVGRVQEAVAETGVSQTLPETAFQALGQFGGAVGDIAAGAVTTAGRAVLPQETEERIGETVTSAMERTGIPQFIAEQTPRTQRNIEAGLGVAELAGFKALTSVTNKVARKALNASDDVLDRSRVANPVATTPLALDTSAFQQAIKDFRFRLSDIDPQVETVLKRSSADDVNKFFVQARNAAADSRQPTPLEIAGESAERAYDVIDEARRKAVQGKNSILADVANDPAPAGLVDDVLRSGSDSMSERFGVKINPDGTIEDVAGRFSKLDAPDQKLVTEYFSRLNSLGDTPTLKQIDDFVDWAQSQLYKQSKTLSQLEAADRAVVSSLKGVTGDLNNGLKGAVGGGYGDVNARISGLIELQDELSRALGADARKGGGLMKRLFSPTGGNTRRIFDDIRRETGIDLDKEANLAKFAMESSGDIRQRSLLQKLDVGIRSAQDFDITRPLSIIRFIRERIDLDDQTLANEIIRRTSSGQ